VDWSTCVSNKEDREKRIVGNSWECHRSFVGGRWEPRDRKLIVQKEYLIIKGGVGGV